MKFDPRVTLARSDLAVTELEGLVRADKFATAAPMQLIVPAAALRSAPERGAEQVDQLLFGEIFDVLEVSDGFAWGQARRDGYVGFVDRAALSPLATAPTHWVSAVTTFAFERPSIKSPAFGPLSLNALVSIDGEADRLQHAAGAGWLPMAHLTRLGTVLPDPVAVAEGFVGIPYLWGGRDSLGLDCSGLVQQALYACGRSCPRDTDQQACLGAAIDRRSLRRGDLVFWRGHVGLMSDDQHLVHANAHNMSVVVEPLEGAVARIAQGPAGPPSGFRRL